jgi:ectoine hydroxylase-related dioxygenase (phytanoyl-CoA dioxygenase family)
MMTEQQLHEFVTVGATTIDTPFTAAQIDAAAGAVDREFPDAPVGTTMRDYRLQHSDSYFYPELIALIQHPFLESVAKRTLRSESVEFCATAIAKTFPEPNGKFDYWEHVDIKYRLSDLDATPRKMICSCLIWLTDVTPDRAPLMFRPGSHRQIAADMEIRPSFIDNPVSFDQLPKLDYADSQPLLARKGQMTVCTTSLIHGASNNIGKLDRKVMFVTFVPQGFAIRANMASAQKRMEFKNKLRGLLSPERRHIIPEAALV